MLSTLVLLVAAGAMNDGVSMKFIASGATAKTGYRPILAEMVDKTESVKVAPEGLVSPKYGTLELGENSFGFILDEPEGKKAKLFIDSNRDGDYTNDPDTKWTGKTANKLTMYEGETQVQLADGVLGAVRMYRFDPTDQRREKLKNTLLYYADFGYEVTFELDKRSFTSFVAGQPDENTTFWIDRDGNKQQSVKREMAQVGKSFNFTGTTYVIKATGGELALEKSTEPLPMTPLPPDLSVGKQALPFKMTTMDGTKIDFPKTYAGKIVMLDFWATWCGPCIAEIPNVKQAYADWHDKGFEILGISFDDEDMAEKVTEFTKKREMPWQQIYEGKVWDTTLGEQYDVGSIPFVLLVDGDTNEILATRRELRGPGLSQFIEKALAKKSGADK
jgi:thiol-disulfide isomerase/thioredoxin